MPSVIGFSHLSAMMHPKECGTNISNRVMLYNTFLFHNVDMVGLTNS
jgi:hypothetical protein